MSSGQAARWAGVERIFDEALDLPEAERAPFLKQRCAGDAALHAEVLSLLAAAGAAEGFLEDLPTVRAQAAPDTPFQQSLQAGDVVGDWLVSRLIGHGGMSDVYLAERSGGQYAQRAALKLLSRDLARKAHHLQEERQILAQLEHPGITRLIDGGEMADGRPYLVMEYVEGRNILEHCRAIAASLEQRLAIFLQVCDAVAYAHRHLVVHRDLKPGNILVTADGSVRLLDFGIAKLLGPPRLDGGDSNRTLHLTPAYAAPEQLQGQAVTTAADVYSLGVLLYELLCGKAPFDIAALPMTLALHRVLNDTPAAPSAIARTLAAPPVPVTALRGDLDHIVAKALRKEPEHRYASAAELKTDIERFRRHEPVTARSYAPRYVIGRFVRRHRLAVSLALGAVAALVLGLSLSLWFYVEARQARLRAETAAATTQAINDFLNRDLLAGIQLEARPTKDVSLRELLDNAAAQTDQRFAAQPETAARVHQSIGESYLNLSLYEASQVQLEKALALYEQVLGRSSDETLAVIARLANVTATRGLTAQAIALYEEVIAAYAKRYGDAYAPLIVLRVEAADTLFGAGDFQRAAVQMKPLLEGPGAQSLSTSDQLDAQARYASFLLWLGDLASAERMHRGALEGRKKLFGEEHLATAVSHLFLAGVLIEQARLPEAEQEATAGLAGVRRWVGPDDAFLAVAEAGLARLRLEQNRLGEAESLLMDAIRIRTTIFGEDSSLLAWTRHQMAEVMKRQGRLKEARALMQTVLRVADKVDGPGNPWTLKQRLVLVSILRELGETSRAQNELASIPADAQARLPKIHPFLGLLSYEQGLVAAQAGGPAAAKAALTQALAIYAICYGGEHPRTREVRTRLAAL